MMDLNKMLDICRRCKYLPENELKQLCERICDILISESNVQPVRLSESLIPLLMLSDNAKDSENAHR